MWNEKKKHRRDSESLTSARILALPVHEHDNMLSTPLFTPTIILGMATAHRVSDLIPTALLFPHVPDWAGLTCRDRLSHVAGDAPLACCLSLHLTTDSWMQSDIRLQKRCECPFSSAWHGTTEFKNTMVVVVSQASLFRSVSRCVWGLLCSQREEVPLALGRFYVQNIGLAL